MTEVAYFSPSNRTITIFRSSIAQGQTERNGNLGIAPPASLMYRMVGAVPHNGPDFPLVDLDRLHDFRGTTVMRSLTPSSTQALAIRKCCHSRDGLDTRRTSTASEIPLLHLRKQRTQWELIPTFHQNEFRYCRTNGISNRIQTCSNHLFVILGFFPGAISLLAFSVNQYEAVRYSGIWVSLFKLK